MAQERDIWVLLEIEDNKISRHSVALLDEGQRLADEFGSQLQALFIGPPIEGIASDVGLHDVQRLYQGTHEDLKQYDPFIYEKVLSNLLKTQQPGVLLALASSIGSDLLPRLAFKLGAPLVTRCVDIEVMDNCELQFLKAVHNGRLFANVVCRGEGCRMATYLPEALSDENQTAVGASGKKELEIESLEVKLNDNVPPVKVTGFMEADHRTIDITEAQVIVAVGRGLCEKENFAAVETFAESIGGAIGGTRPMVDEEILPYSRQIGQTGKRVSPKLIFLCGISGAVEFTQGMKNASSSIAINSDAQAPIMQSVDLGIVGNLNEVLPSLTKYVHQIAQSPTPVTQKGQPAERANGGRSK